MIASYRYGLFAPGRSRVVIDLAQPSVVAGIWVESDEPAGASILVVELKQVGARRVPPCPDREPRRPRPDRRLPGRPPKKRTSRPVIVIDPGHGGIDPGGRGDEQRHREGPGVWDLPDISRESSRVQHIIKVLLTRDSTPSSHWATGCARPDPPKADLFIRSTPISLSGGQECARADRLYRVRARLRRGFGPARRPGEQGGRRSRPRFRRRPGRGPRYPAGTDLPGDPDLLAPVRRKAGERARFAVAQLNKNPRREAGFKVLRAHDVPRPAELGYLSSRKDLRHAVSEEWRGKAVASIAVAIEPFFATRLARQGAAAVSP